MTPKEVYEAGKAERKAERERMAATDKPNDEKMPLAMLDMLDRFVTAAERITEAHERIAGAVELLAESEAALARAKLGIGE